MRPLEKAHFIFTEEIPKKHSKTKDLEIRKHN